MNPSSDKRIVMTLDAGGTNFHFSAIRGNTVIAGPVMMPSEGDNLDKCLDNIVEGFNRIRIRYRYKDPFIDFRQYINTF